jgi:hypothetical protein
MDGKGTLRPVSVHGHNEGFETVFRDSLSDEMAGGQWQQLVADMGANTAHAVQEVTDRLAELIAKGRIAESDARWLLNPLQPLYHAGISAQKLSHFVGRNLSAVTEAVSLDAMVSEAVQQRSRASPRHVFVKELVPLDVVVEPEMLSGALESLLAWGEGLGSHLHLRLIRQSGQPRGELWLSVTRLFANEPQAPNLNSLQWYVLWQMARLKGVKVKRKIESDRIRVMVRFERVASQNSDLAPLETRRPHNQDRLFHPAATRVWTLLPAQPVQKTAHLSMSLGDMKPARVLKEIGELVDATDLPHCVVTTPEVIESEEFTYWRQFAQESKGQLIAVVAIIDRPNIFEVSGYGPTSVVSLSATEIPSRLVSTILFEVERLAEI